MNTPTQLDQQNARLITRLTAIPGIEYIGTFTPDTLPLFPPSVCGRPSPVSRPPSPTCPTCRTPLTTLRLCPHCGVRHEQ